MSSLDDHDFRDAFRQRFAAFHNNDALSDFTISCGQSRWKVHKFVLSVHSRVLASACSGNFKEGREGVLDLSKHGVGEVEALVHWFYAFDYECQELEDNSPFDALSFHIKMAIIADKYFLDGLNDLACRKFIDLSDSIMLEDDEDTDLAKLALEAYSVSHATKDICRDLIDLIIERLPLEQGKHKALWQAMGGQAEFAVDIARGLQGQCRDLNRRLEDATSNKRMRGR
ncbi:hypothetical protein TI39_contig5839g00029 [Zymoseptoria brevis]|uniref:BTB domain-containing protein n=1 Tax=Zymoseptoria brevis TaxID=1047168 RepID=A0A0F4G5M4_9PEZI|nr:hypothetical protein TI39_contig5839g00029 [Zymoseptoria brevis]